MPFFDTTGTERDERRGPLWGAFAAVAGQPERMAAVSLLWSGTLLPGLLAFGFTGWPAWLRTALLLLSAATLGPATGALFALARVASEDGHVGLEAAGDALRELALPSILRLMPLYAGLGLLGTAAGWAAAAPALETLLRLALLLLALSATYWGPLFAAEPGRGSLATLAEAARLTWRRPGATLLAAGAVALTLLLGAVSVGGLFLIVPALVALLQVEIYRHITAD